MAKTVVALYDNFDTARSAVEALVDAGFNRSDLSLVANNAAGEYDRYVDVVKVNDGDVSAGEGAGFGAVVGALVGLGVALIPGVGPVLAAGPLAAALMAGIGAASGAVTGGVVAGLVDFGVPEDHATNYAEGIRRGGTLVTVHLDQDEWADRAQSVLNRFNPVDIDERSGQWRSGGWTGSEPITSSQTMDNIREQNRTAAATSAATATAPVTTYQPYSFYEPRFRNNYDLNYVSSGYDFTIYEPAYRYGYSLGTDPAYQNRSWSEVEPDVHVYWDKNYPGTWDRVKNSIRDAWEEVTGR
jgi:uncharacterized membrane protein